MWLDFAEDQAARKKQVFLRDWVEKLDQFLQFNDCEVLQAARCRKNPQKAGRGEGVGGIRAFSDGLACRERTAG
ncbi:RhuM family protein [Neisseria leonii]|nr:RhuM family protein [Neisseria sp. 3986]MDD9324970.1 virulence RhuM family protein [Neisseria sp. 3986]